MVASLIDRAKGSPSSVQEDQEQPRPDRFCTVDRWVEVFGHGWGDFPSHIGKMSREDFKFFY